MKKFVLGFVALGLMALITVSANAQFGGRGAGGAMLLNNKSVQQELKITDDQKTKIADKRTELEPKMKEIFAKYNDVPKEERREKMGDMAKEIAALVQKEVDAILTKDQLKRLKQIQIQQMGTEAFNDETVAKVLEATAEQKDKAKAIDEEMRKDMRELREAMKDDKAGTLKKMGNLRKESMEKAMALMTDDQKKKWKELTGEAFALVQEGGFGGGRPFGKKKDE